MIIIIVVIIIIIIMIIVIIIIISIIIIIILRGAEAEQVVVQVAVADAQQIGRRARRGQGRREALAHVPERLGAEGLAWPTARAN